MTKDLKGNADAMDGALKAVHELLWELYLVLNTHYYTLRSLKSNLRTVNSIITLAFRTLYSHLE
jgi:hypothetical protein